ncbi:endonuclease/exonuclease/phosphatase [Magnaporthiopsis poae ATCC 64411]|uniref:Endonuclease/exonuclease/phosphatase n=1 Tax=Magnaporthiopsis poae (strain ATCC 64411 / 73-15) TaxID=644358 RepID=A0A0C4DUX9_MAGP6|nr:endonuclease/exonuclease/phosphatase [Magnaporthiopsis poae ATCC 64411]
MKFNAVLALSALAKTALAYNGEFSALAMNVAGLPAFLQGNDVPGDKAVNARLIGQKFSDQNIDIVHVQEDFNYHAMLYENNRHPQRTPTSGGVPFGQGLNTLSSFPWVDFQRIKWDQCSNASGADCLTPKGFTFMRMRIAGEGSAAVYMDVYNLHADAGTEPDDLKARTSNLRQVAAYILKNSVGNPVLVFGDTNSRYSRTADVGLRELLATQNPTGPGLKDAWVEIQRGGVVPTEETLCTNPSTTDKCETVDKIFYRGSPLLDLTATAWSYESKRFLQPERIVL